MKTPLDAARWLAARFEEEGLDYRVLDALDRAGAMVDRSTAARAVASTGLLMACLPRGVTPWRWQRPVRGGGG